MDFYTPTMPKLCLSRSSVPLPALDFRFFYFAEARLSYFIIPENSFNFASKRFAYEFTGGKSSVRVEYCCSGSK
ncbi:hypothetical protein M8C21_010023 [Ambrosia artemisiifolia]|uniref:Uncharacterized protein n=1 Tax=Ambrosia artemisiifolia TaxID=4212 RepID=A0AAD5G769_AMBAR|nr:hypothetical protein M8C21_010023 [Ambrosia artemisiifolia]